MTGEAEITIKDGSTTKFVMKGVQRVDDKNQVAISQLGSDGSTDPSLDHNVTVVDTITVTVKLTDKGTYNAGVDPGTTGTIYKQKALLKALTAQAENVVTFAYTMEFNFDSEDTGLIGVIKDIIFEQQAISTGGSESVDSGTTTSTSANKLVQTGQNFQTTVSVGDWVHNTTDNTKANVTAVDSDTILSLSGDIMASGEVFTIFSKPGGAIIATVVFIVSGDVFNF